MDAREFIRYSARLENGEWVIARETFSGWRLVKVLGPKKALTRSQADQLVEKFRAEGNASDEREGL